MSIGRVVLASVVGGIATFVWGAIAHMALPIGEMGVRMNMPGEQMIAPALKFNIQEKGFYMFPGMDPNDQSAAAQKAWEDKYRQGPSGILIVNPGGAEFNFPRLLGQEFVSSTLAALMLSLVLSRVRGGVFAKAMLGAVIGLFGWLSIDVSYWNWYDFPTSKTIGSMMEQGIGGLICGLTIALVLGRERSPIFPSSR